MNTKEIKKILIATDYSELSDTALKTAIAIGKRHNASITVYHVIDEMLFSQANSEFNSPNFTINLLISEEELKLSETRHKIMLEMGAYCSVDFEIGKPVSAICEYAKKNNYDLIVMGFRGFSRLKSLFFSSTVYSVMKQAHCPVLAIPSTWESHEFKNILFPIRKNVGLFLKYSFVSPIVEANNASLHLLSIFDYMISKKGMQKYLQKINQLKKKLDYDKRLFCSSVKITNNVSEQVKFTLSCSNSDLIVVGIDYSSFSNLFFGTYAKQLLSIAKKPILSVGKGVMIDGQYY